MNSDPARYNNKSDAELWRMVTAEDRSAFSFIFYEYSGLLFKFGLTLVKDEELVKDAIQDFFIYLWDHKANIDEIHHLRAYLLTAFRRFVLRIAAKRDKSAELRENMELLEVQGYSTFASDDQDWKADRESVIREAIKMLPGRLREVVNSQAAIESFSEVINSGYSLLPNYEDVFDPRHKNSAESIFDVQYNASIEGEASSYAYRFVPFNSGNNIVPFNDLNPGQAGYNIPTRDIINAYEPGDLRKSASIAYFVQDGNAQFDVSIGDSIPYILKFVHPFDQPGRTNENWPVYRFAHVLLMMAEAINEVSGPTSEARSYVNQVRSRAGLPEVDPGLDQEAFRQLIYHEQRLELAFENHRWYQLVRTGRAVEVMTAHGKEEKALKSRLPPESFQVEEYMLLYPVPYREVRLNDFEQNPGW